MESIDNILQRVEEAKTFSQLVKEHRKKSVTVHLENLVGGALSLYSAALVRRVGGVHIFVAEDRDSAAYMLNDFYALLDEERVHFFPTSYKKSIIYGKEDAQGVVQRTNALNALRHNRDGYVVVCTYPDALAERVADEGSLAERSIRLRVGDRVVIAELEEQLVERGFQQVDFVYEPGQYSLRGGIVDVFSYSESRPFRLDFFGDEIDSIRRFNISSQLSHDKTDEVEIVPNMNSTDVEKVSLVRFAGDATCWFYDADFVLKRVNDLRRRLLGEMEEPSKIDTLMTSRNGLLKDMAEGRMFLLRDNLKERVADVTVTFSTTPQ
ncbi:MAG: transcription-repair coupling factor, partial [Alistipes sp.]|nr:transcription-repair coupling factor [Alistipes sp.]